MNTEHKAIYEAVKDGRITREDAVKKINALRQDEHKHSDLEIRNFAEALMTETLSKIIELPVARIDIDSPFEDYGVDSVKVLRVTNALEEVFGELSKTLLFEHQCLSDLAGYFIEQHEERLTTLLQRTFDTTITSAPIGKLSAKTPKETLCEKIKKASKPSALSAAASVKQESDNRSYRENDVAIIGLSGKYPQAANLDEFWDNLVEGKDCVTEVPKNRWNIDDYYNPEKGIAGKSYSKWGGFIDNPFHFDPLFFNISPKEAKWADPQERLFLQSVYETIEDAGYTKKSLSGNNPNGIPLSVGVYVGAMFSEYQLHAVQEQALGKPSMAGSGFSTIANRASYFFNFHGPSMAVDTMCSSSLTAIHLAYQSIVNQDCDLAIAGGVNLSLHPNKYLQLSIGQFVSANGKCQSFGSNGDGYVPGEGVGSALLKPLSKAIEDGDHIYGIIKGTEVNHGGKTNGYTVPNPKAQTSVVSRALHKSGINPRSVSYIEAHGTGTSLGDPIEITGLSSAFDQGHNEKQFCAIGSVKSNIGHCEGAAGIAGVTKVLLQMQHKTLVPSLHSEKLNPFIKFQESPFYVQQECQAWNAPIIDGKQETRIAGISSFGAGGSNAHLIIEEYLPTEDKKSNSPTPSVVILSATKQERLDVHVQQLLTALENEKYNDADLWNIAYTLQVGRESFKAKMGLLVSNLDQLKHELKRYIAGDKNSERLAHSTDSKHITLIAAAQGLPSSLLNDWISAKTIDWLQLYPESKPNRISLPTYPFRLKEYRMSNTPSQSQASTPVSLVHKTETGYQASFSSNEFYLKDHHISNAPILPGVMYMELIAQALQQDGNGKNADNVLHFEHIVWIQPLIGFNAQTADIVLNQKDNSRFAFDVKPQREEQAVYCQGSATLSNGSRPNKVDLHYLQSQCNEGHSIGQNCYDLFATMNIKYGPAHQPLQRIQWGNGMALSHLKLPNSIANTADQFLLHPALMDGAMQSSLGLSLGDNEGGEKTGIAPFAIEQVNVFSSLPNEVWVWVRPSQGVKENSRVQKVDLDVIDSEGNVCVQLHRVTIRKIDLSTVKTPKLSTPKHINETHKPTAIIEKSDLGVPAAQKQFKELETVATTILWAELSHMGLTDNAGTINDILKTLSIEIKHKQWIEESLRTLASNGLLTINNGLYNVNTAKKITRVLAWKIWFAKKPAWKKNQQMTAQVDLLESCLKSLGNILTAKIHATDIIFPNSSMELVENIYKNNYVADFFNQSLADYIANAIEQRIKQDPQAKIRLLEVGAGTGGTSALVFEALKPYEKNIAEYCYTDLSKAFLLHAEENYAPDTPYLSYAIFNAEKHPQAQDIDNNFDIVIAANVLHATKNMTETLNNIKATLKPQGILAVNEITAKKTFAHLTFGLLDGWWKFNDPDMRLTGTAALSVDHWRSILTRLGFDNITQPVVDANHLGQQIIISQSDGSVEPYIPSITTPSQPHTRATIQANSRDKQTSENNYDKHLLKATMDLLTEDLCLVLKMPASKIDPDNSLDEYGVDSILASRVSNKMNKRIPFVNATMIYEYSTISLLAEHLISIDRDAIAKICGISENSETKNDEPSHVAEPITSPSLPENQSTPFENATPPKSQHEDIAIIGVSGKYPGAENIEELWENLSQGRSSVSEIPELRWDWREHYSEDNKPGEIYSKWGAFLKNIDRFDADFFGIPSQEAAWTDPQERLLLETAYNCLEDAGYTADELDKDNKVGVFVGVTNGFYGSGPQYFSMANRISHNFDFKGPSFAIDSACSSSLTGVHLAVESLRSGTSKCALVGGVNLILSPQQYQELCFTGMLTPDDKCQSFSQHANGFVDGEAVGVLLLKPLSQAQKDGDNIHGVIKSTMINSSGRNKRYATPKASEQTRVIVDAIEQANIDPRTINYIEAHATGTPMGDSIEVMGLSNALRKFTNEKQYCAVGSYKPNIGYCESASGVAGITKVLLQLRHKQLAPSIHSEQLNPEIDFANSPVYVQQNLAEWKQVSLEENGTTTHYPRRAGISSFGATGANAHVIIEEYTSPKKQKSNASETLTENEIFLLSAKTTSALLSRAHALRDTLVAQPRINLSSVAYTLKIGREHLEHRLAFIAKSVEDLIEQLDSFVDNETKLIEGAYCSEDDASSHILQRFAKEAAFQGMLQQWFDENQYDKLAELWTQGTTISWNTLSESSPQQRVSLPTYPFEGDRHWLNNDGLIQNTNVFSSDEKTSVELKQAQ